MPILVAAGLAAGGSLDNAVLFDDRGVPMNEEGLRMEYEYAWHKLLDCVGDLTLAGLPIDGHYYAVKPGHGLNVSVLRKLMAMEENYEIVSH